MKAGWELGWEGGKQENEKGETGEGTQHWRREPTERMWRIHEYLAAGEYPNCSRLAKEFEVSHKTIARDVEYMRDHFGLPIEYDSHRHGFFYTTVVQHFPGAEGVSDTELFALVVAHKASAQYQGLALQRSLERGFKKLLGRLGGLSRAGAQRLYGAVSFRAGEVEALDPAVMALITKAVTERHGLVFSYREPGEERSALRMVRPYHVVCVENRFYVLGHDEERGEVRRFAVARMVGAAQTGERFERPPEFNPEEYFQGGCGGGPAKVDYEVVVQFDAWATDVMRGRRWYEGQEVVDLDGGGSLFRVKIGCLDGVERWVLGWGSHARVIEPGELRDRVVDAAAGMMGRYRASY